MCGIAGKLVFDEAARVTGPEISAMIEAIAHRGPDGQGVHLDRNVGLGHCRLSIIDLNTGAQPMANEDETAWIVFNGEIYNFQELRDNLVKRGHQFRSQTDTEVIVHLYEEYGLDCVEHLHGMFAFAIWDTRRRRLFLARDRVGIKPLYYCQTPGAFSFASELKALVGEPTAGRDLSLPALRRFLAFNYLPGEDTLFKAIRKLPPGHSLVAEHGSVATRQYWDLRFTGERGSMPFEAAAEELESLLNRTVREHMIADVPVGVLLSGGVDSSAVLSFAVRNTRKRIKTFTVGFADHGVVDERPYARKAAERFGAEHFETSFSAEDFWSFLPSYVWHMEEPVCEPPAVALYYVSKLARSHVKVLLSGEGGDEAFGGYPNYPNMLRLDRIRRTLGPLARPVGAAATVVAKLLRDERFHRYAYALGRPLAAHYYSRTSGPTAYFNRRSCPLFSEAFQTETSAAAVAAFAAGVVEPVRSESLLSQMLYVDSKTWLPDDLLVKADKMTMANSLELRVPLLDHRVLEFAASLPSEFKVWGRQTKRVLKAAFHRALPPQVLRRKKAGFPVPYEHWLRDRFQQQVADVLLSERALARGYFQPRELRRLLQTNGQRGGFPKEIFSLLAVEFWHRAFVDAAPAVRS